MYADSTDNTFLCALKVRPSTTISRSANWPLCHISASASRNRGSRPGPSSSSFAGPLLLKQERPLLLKQDLLAG
eukprot:6973314-Prymnesium_polylepis.1